MPRPVSDSVPPRASRTISSRVVTRTPSRCASGFRHRSYSARDSAARPATARASAAMIGWAGAPADGLAVGVPIPLAVLPVIDQCSQVPPLVPGPMPIR